jgi:hypothetical protein
VYVAPKNMDKIGFPKTVKNLEYFIFVGDGFIRNLMLYFGIIPSKGLPENLETL